jgi:hypothetical protein
VILTILTLLATLSLGARLPPDTARSQDACSGVIPTSLRMAAKGAFPGYRLPRRTDNLEEDIAYHKRRGHGACLGVTQGDFNGDTRQDYGILLTSTAGDGALLVAALRGVDGWDFQKLQTLKKDEQSNLYVVTAAPGEYKSFETQRVHLEDGEATSFRSDLQGIVTGTPESSAIGYFWTPTGWIHVWIMN